MPYRFATENRDYSDYASGRVFYSSPGYPAFPVRLASEVFQRCLAIRRANGLTRPVVLYDPCCGGAYHLSTLAYLHWSAIGTIIGSDIDADVLSIAARNLSLLTLAGLEKRREEIVALLDRFGKPSHVAALESAEQLMDQRREQTKSHQVTTRLFTADATSPEALANEFDGQPIDMVISDVPYNLHSTWRQSDPSATSTGSPLWQMLSALWPLLSPDSVVAIAANKGQKCVHERYRRLEYFRMGKRQIVLLQPVNSL